MGFGERTDAKLDFTITDGPKLLGRGILVVLLREEVVMEFAISGAILGIQTPSLQDGIYATCLSGLVC